jgi:hypothetical protein
MAITNGLITAAEYASYAEVTAASAGLRLTSWEDAIEVASRWVEKHTGRQFHETDTGGSPTPSARYFDNVGDKVHITDCQSVTEIATDNADDGTYATVLTSTQYQLLPVGGVDDLLGSVPYTAIKQLQTGVWPTTARERPVKVTGLWGWLAVPDDVKRATAILTQDLLRDPESKFGGLTVANDGIVLGSRVPARTVALLEPYVRVTRAPGLQVA